MDLDRFRNTKYHYSIDFLRGVAALTVVLFHFVTGSNLRFQNFLLLRDIASFGNLGVQVFFVVSGFVIPNAMYNGRYHLKDFKRFLFKRLIRLEPPYLVSVLICLLLAYVSTLSPYYRGQLLSLSVQQVFLHIAYLNAIFKYEWLNPVYWTLAIEFQYYFIMAVLFPLLLSLNKRWVGVLFIIGLALSLFLPLRNFIPFHFPYFFVGISLFLLKIDRISVYQFSGSMVLAFLTIFYNEGWAHMLACLLPIPIILFTDIKYKITIFLGAISYSLYLLHVPIGQRMMNIGENFISNDFVMSLYMLIVISITILISFGFYKLTEAPSKRISKNISY